MMILKRGMTPRVTAVIVTLLMLLSGMLMLGMLMPASGAVTAGTTAGLTKVNQVIRESSSPIPVMGFGATSNAGDKLTKVNITFQSLSGFSTSDLKALDTDSSKSGVGLYRDSGSADDALDSGDTAITLTSISYSGLKVLMTLNENVPASITGSYQWIVVVRTSSTLSNADRFTVIVAANDITFSTGTTQPISQVTGNFLTAYLSNTTSLLSTDFVIGEPAAPVHEAMVLGMKAVDGGDFDYLREVLLTFYDFGTANFNIATDLKALSTDSSVSGVGMYIDSNNPSADVWDASDIAVTFNSLSIAGSKVDAVFWTSGANRVNLLNTSLGGNFDYFWVVRSGSGISEGDDFKVGLETGNIRYGSLVGEDTVAVTNNQTSKKITGDITPPVVPGSKINITSNSVYYYESDTDNLNNNDRVYFNTVGMEGNGQTVTISFNGYTENNPDKLEGEAAFNKVPTGPLDDTDTTNQAIGYTIFQTGSVSNPLTVTVTDKAGHKTYYNCSFITDNTDPVVNTATWSESSNYMWVNTSSNSLIFRDGMTSTEYAYLSGTSSDTGTDQAGLYYCVFSSESSLSSSPSGADYTPSSFFGTYGVDYSSTAASSPAEVLVYDMVRNCGGVQLSYYEDNVNPTVTLLTPSSNGQKVSGVFQVTAKMSDAIPDKMYMSIDGGGTWAQFAWDGSKYVYNWDTYVVDDGIYNIMVKGVDKVGNFAYVTRQVQVENFPLSVSFVSPTDLALLRGLVSVVVNPSTYTVQGSLYLDTSLIGIDDTKDGFGRFSFSLNTGLFSDGYHTLKCVVKGVGGNTTQSQIMVQIDNTGPVISGISVKYPYDQVAAKSSDKITILAYIYENQTAISNITCQANSIGGGIYEGMYDDGLHQDGSSDDDLYGTEKITVNATWAYHQIKVNVTDAAGNSAQLTYDVPVDNHKPMVSEVTGIFPWVQTACKDGDDVRIRADISEDVAPLDAVLVLDDSGSMGTGAGSSLEALLGAAVEFINSTNNQDRISLYTFINGADPLQVQPFIAQDAEGRQATLNNISYIRSIAGQGTPIWDTIGMATDYCISNSTGIPIVIALTDGADDYWNGIPYEEGSTAYAPWNDYGTTVNYRNHIGKYPDYTSGNPIWYKNVFAGVGQNRRGLLNVPIPIFTIGLGLEHHDQPDAPQRTDFPGNGTVDTTNACIAGTESGTPEYNLYRIATSSAGGRYYYAPDKTKLSEIYNALSDVVGDYDTPYGIINAYADATGLGGQSNVPMFDDGAHEDSAAGDGIYATDLFTVKNINTEDVEVTVHVTDIAGNRVQKSGIITVDNVNPAAQNFTIYYNNGLDFALDTEPVYFSVNTTDEDTQILTVYVNATSIGSDDHVILYNDGVGNDVNASDTIYTSLNCTVMTGMETYAYKVITFTIFDAAGNSFIQKQNLRVINDLSAPVCNLVSPTENESLSGSYLFQAQASDDSGIMSVTLELETIGTGAKTKMTLGYSPDTGYYEYQYPTNLLPDNQYWVTATATDNAYKASPSVKLRVYVDNNAPVLYINSPKEGDYLSKNVTFNVVASDNNLYATTYQVDGGAAYPIATPLDTRKETDGPHTITFKATDYGGHYTAKDIHVVIDNNAPAGFIKSPMVSEFIYDIYSVEVVVSDTVGVASVTVDLLGANNSHPLNNVTMGYSVDTDTYKYNMNTLAYNDGLYMLTVWAKDKSGLTSKIGPQPVTLNNLVPDLRVHSPVENERISGMAYLINASVTDADLVAMKYQFSQDNWLPIGTPINTTLYPDGPYKLSVRAFDTGGRYSEASFTVYVDNYAPLCLILSPGTDESLGGQFVFEIKVYDAGGLKSLGMRIDNTTYNPVYYESSGTYKFSMNVDSLGHKPHFLTATATDFAGRVSVAGPLRFVVGYADSDGDGVPDDEDDYPLDPRVGYDTDGDGKPDDIIGKDPGNYTKDGDDDNDGHPDINDTFPIDPKEWEDTDGDGTGDNADYDDDNDGVPDVIDGAPKDIRDSVDSDRDGLGNSIDPDDDNDGVPDEFDDFPTDPGAWRDTDHDGMPDEVNRSVASKFVEDVDDDNDGVRDNKDAFPKDATEWKDNDDDGIGDNADPDIDGDAVANNDDAWPENKYLSGVYLFAALKVIGILILVLAFLFVFLYREKLVDYTFKEVIPRMKAARQERGNEERPRGSRFDRRRGGREEEGARGRRDRDEGKRETGGRRDRNRDRRTGRGASKDEEYWDNEPRSKSASAKRKYKDNYEE